MHPLLIAIFLVLSLSSSGNTKEIISDSSSDHDISKDSTSGLSRAKRGNFNFRRWNRGLQMLRLGKRQSPDDIDEELLESSKDPEGFHFPGNVYGLGDGTLRDANLPIPDGDFDDDYSKRSLAMLRLGKRLSGVRGIGDETKDDTYAKRNLNMLRLGKRQLEMLRLGKRSDDEVEQSLAHLGLNNRLSDIPVDSYNKRTLNMLRLGKRQMQMLRLGKRQNVADTEAPLGQIRFGDMDQKRNMKMLRLGKRHMQMLRLGKREDDDIPLDNIRFGDMSGIKRSMVRLADDVDTSAPLNDIRFGDMLDNNKRNLNMLRLGKRGGDNKDIDSV